MSEQPNFAVYQKPQKSQFDQTYQEQVKQKPQRLWPGMAPNQKINQEQDEEDGIFEKKKIFDEPKSKEREIVLTTIIDEPQNNKQSKKHKDKKKNKHKKEQKDSKQEEIAEDQEQIILNNQLNNEQLEQDEEYYEEEEEPKKIIELLKPVFVSRKDRDNQDISYQSEIRLKEEKEKAIERVKLQNKMIVIQEQNQKEIKDDTDEEGNIALPNDEDDPADDAKLYALWKIRELKRLKRDHDERTQRQREKNEIERRRRLTDQQRIEEDFKLGSDKTKIQDQSKYVFMQKYYHKGAYFQDDNNDPIFQRDYNLPVGEDLQDKSNLPQILQKRRGQFGKKGQSKYTHLTDQDTTNYDPFYQVDEGIRQKFFLKQAGNRSANKFDPYFRKK